MTRTILAAHPGAELFGSDRMLLESAVGFLAGGDRVVVTLPESGPLVDSLEAAGAEVVIAPTLVLRKSLMRPSGWLRLITETARGIASAWRLMSAVAPDVVYVSTITIPLWPLVARARRTRVVSHVHEAEASGSRFLNVALYAPHLAAKSVIVNSEFSLRTIEASVPRLASKSRVVYNGVAGPARSTPVRASVHDTLRVLYVGRLSPRKGPDVALEAAQLLRADGRSVHVSLLGAVFPGYEWFEDELRDTAAQAPPDSVDFLGFRSDIWPFIDACDVLVVPSRLDEPFGNTAVEGILAERPVVASDTSGLREAAGGYDTTRLVAPGDAAALANALAALMDDWVSRADTARAAERARSRHAPELYRTRVRELTLGPLREGTAAEGTDEAR